MCGMPLIQHNMQIRDEMIIKNIDIFIKEHDRIDL